MRTFSSYKVNMLNNNIYCICYDAALSHLTYTTNETVFQLSLPENHAPELKQNVLHASEPLRATGASSRGFQDNVKAP